MCRSMLSIQAWGFIMRKTFKLAIIGGFLAALAGCGMTLFKTYEEPDYTVISSNNGQPLIEQRRYPAKLMAEVEVSGAREEAINDGFRLLADFIFGNNTAKSSIDMTTPVAQQAAGENTWHVRFFMPKEYTLETLPKPNSDKVNISVQPGYDAVVIRSSGRHSEANLSEHLQLLEKHIAEHGLMIQGDPTYAFFDPPWTPWFMKRNEISYPLQGGTEK